MGMYTHANIFFVVSISQKIFVYILGGSRDNVNIRFPYWVTVFHTRDGKRIYIYIRFCTRGWCGRIYTFSVTGNVSSIRGTENVHIRFKRYDLK